MKSRDQTRAFSILTHLSHNGQYISSDGLISVKFYHGFISHKQNFNSRLRIDCPCVSSIILSDLRVPPSSDFRKFGGG